MSTSLAATFTFIGQQASIFVGIPILISGIIGGFLAIIVFVSLETFLKSSCAFYLTVMSIFNIGQLLSGLLFFIMINGYDINWTNTSLLLCKLKIFIMEVCSLSSLTCICLATIDQYFATCSRPRWQQWSNLKLARRLVAAFVLIWILHGILYLVFVNIVHVPSTSITYCSTTYYMFLQYHNYFNLLILIEFLPIGILASFGSGAYYNARQLNYRIVPLVRQQLDKQLTVMVLLQVFLNFLSLLPYDIVNILLLNSTIMSNPLTAVKIQFANTLTSLVYYLCFAGPFYIYICASERFRRQLLHVLFKIHLNRIRQPIIINNQVVPQS